MEKTVKTESLQEWKERRKEDALGLKRYLMGRVIEIGRWWNPFEQRKQPKTRNHAKRRDRNKRKKARLLQEYCRVINRQRRNRGLAA